MPRSRAANPPLYEIPGRISGTPEHLNLHPEHGKNVPIFAMQGEYG